MTERQFTFLPEEARDMEQKFRIVRRSVDARHKPIRVLLTILCDDEGEPVPHDAPIPLYTPPTYQMVGDKADKPSPEVNIIGMGPAGLFAALTLLEHGIKPIIYERGREVSARKRDIALLNRNEGLNPESNYCFGEGGAGTFSDGKLFSRSKRRGNMQRVMELFHYFGANDSVLYESHAHIGSDRLPEIIRNMRECILEYGGEIHFDTRIDSLEPLLRPDVNGKVKPCILAIGHSAHDTYHILAREGVALEPKGFALGVRLEHPQKLINKLMYHRAPKFIVEALGNASYALVTQVEGRGVYSFCMCPGGHIVPAGSTTDGCVVNGMSASHRNSPFANSGIVVEVRAEDVTDKIGTEGAIEALEYQEHYEQLARENGGPHAECPAQRLRDFVLNTPSVFPEELEPGTRISSYIPGIVASRMDQWMPYEIRKRLQVGFCDFERKYPGFLTNDAIIHGVESRSSSPIRISRDPETMQSVSHPGLYPIGEGAGYAGGITSSALDGINAALRIVADLQKYE